MQNTYTDDVVWEGRPSQITLMPTYIACVLLSWLIIPVFYAAWKWLVLHNTRYTLTTQRLRVRKGVFNKITDDMELYRIRDMQLQEPLHLRFFNLSSILLITADESTPILELSSIEEGSAVRDMIRENTEKARAMRGVREFL